MSCDRASRSIVPPHYQARPVRVTGVDDFTRGEALGHVAVGGSLDEKLLFDVPVGGQVDGRCVEAEVSRRVTGTVARNRAGDGGRRSLRECYSGDGYAKGKRGRDRDRGEDCARLQTQQGRDGSSGARQGEYDTAPDPTMATPRPLLH